MNNLLGIEIQPRLREEIIHDIERNLEKKTFVHIVSLNPEIVVSSQSDDRYKQIINQAEIKLIDGIGIKIAGKILKVDVGERITGADLMKQLIETANHKNLRVCIIGGQSNVAIELVKNLKEKYTGADFKGLMGYADIYHPSTKEESEVQKILKEFSPDLVFVAFGAPAQDFWINEHRPFLKHSICMSVGGAVDFLSGKVPRAPLLIRKLGLEWLFRLIMQPWRWKRQLKLLTFIKLVLQKKFGS